MLFVNLNRVYLIKEFNVSDERELVKQLEDLAAVDLSQRKIFSIDPSTFHGLAQLTRVDLSHNSIEALELGVFAGLRNMTELVLYDNLIMRIEEGVLAGLLNLKVRTLTIF